MNPALKAWFDAARQIIDAAKQSGDTAALPALRIELDAARDLYKSKGSDDAEARAAGSRAACELSVLDDVLSGEYAARRARDIERDEKCRLLWLAAQAEDGLRKARVSPGKPPPAGMCHVRCKHPLVNHKLPNGKWSVIRTCQKPGTRVAPPRDAAPADLVKLVERLLWVKP
jgi:hypothetical protein